MKVQVLFLGFALVAVISAAPIEEKAAEAEYHPEDFEIDPTQYEKLLENLHIYDELLEEDCGDESLDKTIGYEELVQTDLGNGTVQVVRHGVEMSVSDLGEGFGDDDIVLAAALSDEPLGETYGYEELLGTEMGNDTLLGVDALYEDEDVSEEDKKLMELALENLHLEDVVNAAGSDGEIKPDAE